MTQRLPLYLSASLLAHLAVLLAWHTVPMPPSTLAEPSLQVSLIQTVRQTTTRLAAAVQAHDTPSIQHNSISRRAPARARHTDSTRHTKVSSTTTPEPAAMTVTANTPATPTQTSNLSADTAERLQNVLRIAFKSYFSYPAMAQRHGWEGVVKLSLRIDPDGRLSEIRLIQSSGHAALDTAALATAQRIPPLHEAVAWLQGNSHVIQLPVEYRLIDG